MLRERECPLPRLAASHIGHLRRIAPASTIVSCDGCPYGRALVETKEDGTVTTDFYNTRGDKNCPPASTNPIE